MLIWSSGFHPKLSDVTWSLFSKMHMMLGFLTLMTVLSSSVAFEKFWTNPRGVASKGDIANCKLLFLVGGILHAVIICSIDKSTGFANKGSRCTTQVVGIQTNQQIYL
jgi:hypothetical protein